jgi:GNAT superfamily N-acetyltransferase
MDIRPIDIATDLDSILDILGRSLSHPGNRDWFMWKHVENPFGASPGFVAVENGKILGVRLFMKWKFRMGNSVLEALRPVDTATHPDARGKGVFKMLTLDALNVLNPSGNQIIFNTPNNNSLPGYLKMGWKPFVQKFYSFYYFVSPFNNTPAVQFHKNFENIDFSDRVLPGEVIETDKTIDFFSWRYKPENYAIATLQNDASSFLVYKVLKRYGASIVIIKDFYGEQQMFSELVKAVAKSHRAFLAHAIDFPPFCSSLGFGKMRRGESVVVYRGREEYQKFQWRLSPGDLEGIL